VEQVHFRAVMVGIVPRVDTDERGRRDHWRLE
jgi:hypothetical protein